MWQLPLGISIYLAVVLCCHSCLFVRAALEQLHRQEPQPSLPLREGFHLLPLLLGTAGASAAPAAPTAASLVAATTAAAGAAVAGAAATALALATASSQADVTLHGRAKAADDGVYE